MLEGVGEGGVDRLKDVLLIEKVKGPRASAMPQVAQLGPGRGRRGEIRSAASDWRRRRWGARLGGEGGIVDAMAEEGGINREGGCSGKFRSEARLAV